jgi:acyl-CoA synthetase (AMP-forming)/AMP-acid ligase II
VTTAAGTAFRPAATPPPQIGAAHDRDAWKIRLYGRLRERAYPLFHFGSYIVPAAAVWAGARLWTTAFREAGLRAGDRVVVALPASAAFVQVLVAAIWEGLTLVPVGPRGCRENGVDLITAVDARCRIADTPEANGEDAHTLYAPTCEGPLYPEGFRLREARLPGTPETRFLLRTSGTTSGGRFVALSDAAVWRVLDSHLPALRLREAETRLLSVLPWHHAFGLVLDLLPALLSGAEINRVLSGGGDVDALLRVGEEVGATHLNAVPLTIRRLGASERGRRLLRSLRGGIVGGAPVDGPLAELLATTRLRAGYGQTEAGPGIALGEPGVWPGAGYLGRPLGCHTRIGVDGVLHFSGVNAFSGYWSPENGLVSRAESGWVRTGDIVQTAPGGHLFFAGREDDAFKLSNGRCVEAGFYEARLMARVTAITDALLYSPDGETLEAAVTVAPGAPVPPLSEVAGALGSLGGRLTRLRPVSDSFWARTPKGTVLRRETLERLTCSKD